ncbi:MAG: hypothetical protein AAFY01_02940 [Pseudomonadota bacterium]
MTSRHLLMILTGAFGAMGLFFVLSPSMTVSFFDWMIYGGYEASPVQAGLMQGETRRYAGFIYQVLGAVIFGWAILLTLVVKGPTETQITTGAIAPWLWRCVALSMGGWFVLDTAMSLVMGFWQNAVFNTLFGVAAAVGLFLWRPQDTR